MGRSKGKAALVEENNGMTPSPFDTTYVAKSYSRFRFKDMNIPIEFDTREELDKFMQFYQRRMEPTRWAHKKTMNEMGITKQLDTICHRMGITKFFRCKDESYRILTSEFLATYQFQEKSRENRHPFVAFQLVGNYHKMKLSTFARCLDLPEPLTSTGKLTQRTPLQRMQTGEFWRIITWSTTPYNSAKAKQASIRNPNMRYLARILASSLFPSAETHANVSAITLQMLSDALQKDRVRITDLVTILADHMRKIANSPPSKTVCIGGIVTMLGKLMGFKPEEHSPLSGGRKLDMRTVKFFTIADGRYLAEIVLGRRAIALPNFPRYDLDDRDTWPMPLGDDEYTYDRPTDNWVMVEYGLAPGEVRYDDVELHNDDDDDDDDDDDNDGEEEGEEEEGEEEGGEDMDLDDSLPIGEALRRVRQRGREEEGGASGSGGPSNYVRQSQFPNFPNQPGAQGMPPQFQQGMNEFPFGNYFNPNYVHPQMQQMCNQQQQYGTRMESIDNNMIKLMKHLETQETLNEKRWGDQTKVNDDLVTRMENLSVQQANYLNPMYTNVVGYPPTGYEFQNPFHPVPQDWTWENRVRFPGPDYRPPGSQ